MAKSKIVPTIVSSITTKSGSGYFLRKITNGIPLHYRTDSHKKWGEELTASCVMSFQAAAALHKKLQMQEGLTIEVVELLLQPILLVDPSV